MRDKIRNISVLTMLFGIVVIIIWIIYSIWVENNSEIVNKIGETDIVVLIVSVLVIKFIDDTDD